MSALDTNGDREISAEEIKNAGKSLAKLDKDGNGKLLGDEITDRMKFLVDRFDADADGVLTKEELERGLRQNRGRRPRSEDQRRERTDGT